MSNVDKYFHLNTIARGMTRPKAGVSAIILKADNLRMHARRDIKIIAGGDYNGNSQKVDSAGNILIQEPRIHIMVGNGKGGYSDAQAVPMGDNLLQCIERIYDCQQNILESVNLMMTTQQALNIVLSHVIPVVAPGLTGPGSPPSWAMNMVKNYYDAANTFNHYFAKFGNLPLDKFEFLKPSSKKFILSRSVFINSKQDGGPDVESLQDAPRGVGGSVA